MKPIPVSSSANPTTIPKSATCCAMYARFSADVSAVSVTHRSRAPFATGWPFASVTAYIGLSVPPPLSSWFAGAPGFAWKRPIWE